MRALWFSVAILIQLTELSSLKISLPRCVIVARGNLLQEKHLKVLDDILEAVIGVQSPQQSPQQQTPVVILDKRDKKNTLRHVLLDETYLGRDHVIREDQMFQGTTRDYALALPNVPVILFSGTTREETLGIIRALKTWESPQFPRCAFAVCVEPALEKSFDQLLDEIQRDFSDESKGIKHGMGRE